MARAGKDRPGDRRVGFTAEGRVEDDWRGWDGGMGMWLRKQGVEYRERGLMDDLIKCWKQTDSY